MSEAVSTDEKLIIFELKGKEYAISVHQVMSIEKKMHITRIPNIAPFVKGVINLRGVVTPIIDLRLRFDLEEIKYTDSTRIIIIMLEDMEVGIIVDSANDVVDVDTSKYEAAPETIGGNEVDYIKGVVKLDKRLLILVDLEKVFDRNVLKNFMKNKSDE
ncbi:chemotaxis protein CheW [Bacillus sp. B1-b2]|uniref:chemotaxis protein CheW n=1 Tax=Bacillus sp. B1-b2 TaxID=2653201 RepID=UPI001262008B|nr:chemotaxis protein CheW [Bacillus sp. B1-b2]KAB7668659.1 chemotaxis protein CheW [Bacillus sp. B1-b2]